MRIRAAFLVLFALLGSGCVGGAGEDVSPGSAAIEAVDPWGGEERQTLLDSEGFGFEFDFLCVFGGGPRMDRADGWVLQGTAHLEVEVAIDPSYTGVQVGYIVSEEAADYETGQEGIRWLPTVRAGTEIFELEVPADAIETRDGPRLWHFYRHMNPGDERLCYTGGGAGSMHIQIVAVKGAE